MLKKEKENRKMLGVLAALPLQEAVRAAAPLLRDADTQVAIAVELLDLIAPDTALADARLVVRTLATHCTARHSAVTAQLLALLMVFDSCERAPVVLLLLDVVPQFVPSDAPTADVVAALKALLQSDRAYLVPILGALSELPLSASSKRDMLDLSLAALEIVDSSDVPTVVRTLLRTMSKQTCDTIVRAIRDECAVLPHAARSVVQEVLSQALRVNGLAVTGFLKSIGDAKDTKGIQRLDLFVLLTLVSRPLTRGAATRATLRAARAGALTFDALADAARCAGEPTWAPLTATLLALHSFLVVAVAQEQLALAPGHTLRDCIVGLSSALLTQRGSSSAAVLASVLAFAAAPHAALALAACEALVVLAHRHGAELAGQANHVQDLLSASVRARAASERPPRGTPRGDPRQLHCICLSLALLASHEPRLQASLLIGVQKRIFGLPSDGAARLGGLALACHVLRSGGAAEGEGRVIVGWLCRLADGGGGGGGGDALLLQRATALDALALVARALPPEICRGALAQCVRPAAIALRLIAAGSAIGPDGSDSPDGVDGVDRLRLHAPDGDDGKEGAARKCAVPLGLEGSAAAAHACAVWRALLALTYHAAQLSAEALFGARFAGCGALACALNASTALACHVVCEPQPRELAALMVARLRDAEGDHLKQAGMPPRMLVAAVALLVPDARNSPLRLRLVCELCRRLGVRRASEAGASAAPSMAAEHDFMSAACAACATLDSRSALHRLLTCIVESAYLRVLFPALHVLSACVHRDWRGDVEEEEEEEEVDEEEEEGEGRSTVGHGAAERCTLLAAHLSIVLRLLQLVQRGELDAALLMRACLAGVDAARSAGAAERVCVLSVAAAAGSSSACGQSDRDATHAGANAAYHFFAELWARSEQSTIAVLLGEIVALLATHLGAARTADVGTLNTRLLHTVFPHEADALFAWLPRTPVALGCAWSAGDPALRGGGGAHGEAHSDRRRGGSTTENMARVERMVRKLPARGTPPREQHVVFQLVGAFALCGTRRAAEGLQHAVGALESFVDRRRQPPASRDDIDVDTHPTLKSLTAQTFSIAYNTIVVLCVLTLSRSAPIAPAELALRGAADARTPYCTVRACAAALLRLLRLQPGAAESSLLGRGSIKALLRCCAVALPLLRMRIEASLAWRAAFAVINGAAPRVAANDEGDASEAAVGRLLGPGALRPLMCEALALVRSIDRMCSAIKSAERSVRAQPRSNATATAKTKGQRGRGQVARESELQLRTVEWQSIPGLVREVETFRQYIHEACAVHHVGVVDGGAEEQAAAGGGGGKRRSCGWPRRRRFCRRRPRVVGTAARRAATAARPRGVVRRPRSTQSPRRSERCGSGRGGAR